VRPRVQIPGPRPISEYDPGVTARAAMAMDHSWITIFQIANEDRNVALCQLAAVSRRSSPLRQRFLGKEKVPGSNPGVGSNVLPRGLIPYSFRNFWKVLGVWSLGGW